MPSKNKPRTQVVVADAPTAGVEQPVDLTPTELELALAVEQATGIVNDARYAALGGVMDALEVEMESPTQPRVGGSADRVEAEDVGAQDLRSALLANAQEECAGYPAPPQVEAPIVPAKPAPTFLVIEPAQLVALGWSEHSAGKIALAVHKAQEAYARLEGHGSYIPAPRLTGLAASRPTPPSGRGAAAKPSGAAVGVSLPSGVVANGQVLTAAARGNAISIYDEATRKVNGKKFAYTDVGWADFNAWLQAKRAAGARVQLKFFSDAQKERLASLAAPSVEVAAATTPHQA
jgi:hypothetical protein